MRPSRRRPCAAAICAVALLAGAPPPARAAPSLDPNNAPQLRAAAVSSLNNLMSYYTPSELGVFDQVQTPWHASGMIWNMFMDYQTWSGDNQYASVVTGALVNLSYGTWQDILGGPLTSTNEKVLGKWNDDILWPAMAIAEGGEIYGANAQMPGAGGTWTVVPQRTLDETWEYHDDQCGGGIFWSRNPQSSGGNYKSLITNVEYIQCAARTNLLNSNSTIMANAQGLWNWMINVGLISTSDGSVYDGFNVPNCTTLVNSAFTYNYGMAIGAAVWLNNFTKTSTYLSLAEQIFTKSMGLFFTTGTVMELCEQTENCGRDAQDFKATYLRNLVYLFRTTQSQTIKNDIFQMVDSSLTQMVGHACDDNWNCNGNWSTGTTPVSYVRSQHVASALLVTALGIHTQPTGAGLVPSVDGGTLNTTGSGTAGQQMGVNNGSIDSWSLDAAPSLRALSWPALAAAVVARVGRLEADDEERAVLETMGPDHVRLVVEVGAHEGWQARGALLVGDGVVEALKEGGVELRGG